MATKVNMRSPKFILIVLLLIITGLLAGCGKRSDPPARGSQAMPVKTETARLQKVPEFSEYLATLRSRRAAVLQPEVEGQITRIFAHAGQRVQAGEPLIEIDPRKQEATVNSQEANRQARMADLEYNRSELERRKQLYAAGVISRQELEQAQNAFDASKAAVDALAANLREQQVQLRYYTVKAPADGILGDIPVREGDRVKTDTVLTTVDQGGELEAYISIPAELAANAHLGTPVDIVTDDGKLEHTRLTFVAPRVDMQNQLLLVKAIVPNGSHRFRNEQLVHTRVIWKEAERPLIPVTSISRLSGQTFAFIAEPGEHGGTVARQKVLRLGDMYSGNYVVLDGIKAGDKVIITGVQMLVDGMPVAPES